jgi:hypothetical protein
MDAKNEPLSPLAIWITRAQHEIAAARVQARPPADPTPHTAGSRGQTWTR